MILARQDARSALEAWAGRFGTLADAAAAQPGARPLRGRGRVDVVPAPPGPWPAETRWVVRRYRRGGALAAALGDRYPRLGTPRPFREYGVLVALADAGIPAARPVGAAVYPSGPFYRGDLVTEWVAGSLDLALFGGEDYELLFAVSPGREAEVEAILVHPPFALTYGCTEHWDGQLPHLGDALGADCTIGKLVERDGQSWLREYQNEGLRNEDWFGWGEDVLAPCDCEVVKVRINPESNQPGILGKPPASSITFRREDGVHVLYAHISNPSVAEGDVVSA